MIRLHVLTAVTRPENLSRIAEAFGFWGKADFEWHLRFDSKREHVGGQALKNAMLDEISDGWVWCLDDDTLPHKRLYAEVAKAVMAADAAAVVVSQRREDRTVLLASPDNLYVGGVDIGQAVIRRDVIGEHRIPESYAGDGEFLMAVLADRNVVYLPRVLSFHNALA